MTPLDLDALAVRLAAHFTVLRPEGPGPFPVVVQMHGCGGITPLQFRYAEAARTAGWAVVVADSLAPRGIGRVQAQLTVCSGLRLRGRERSADLIAALHWLQRQPWADMDNLAAAGWSHGGWSIMEALAEPDWPAEAARLVDGLKTVVVVYPYAGFTARTRRLGWGGRRPKVRALVAGRDAVVGSALPKLAMARLKADGLDVEVLELPDATHCFDDDEAGDPRTRYSRVLEEQARAFYVAALTGIVG